MMAVDLGLLFCPLHKHLAAMDTVPLVLSSSSFDATVCSSHSFSKLNADLSIVNILKISKLESKISRLKAERNELRRLVVRLQKNIREKSYNCESNNKHVNSNLEEKTKTSMVSLQNISNISEIQSGEKTRSISKGVTNTTKISVGVQCKSNDLLNHGKNLEKKNGCDKDDKTKLIRSNQAKQRRIQSLMKTNETQIEQIATISTDNRRYQERLNASQEQIVDLEAHISELRLKCKYAKKEAADYAATSVKNPVIVSLRKKIHILEVNNRRIHEENRRLRSELQCFDSAFFEEIEDLKYNLYSANTLNSKLEQVIQNLSTDKKLGISSKFTKRYAIAIAQLRSITGNAILKKDVKDISCPFRCAMALTTILAEAPIRDPFPPKHAPKHKDQHNGYMSSPRPSSSASCWITGTMVAV
eukprot:UC4_evm3s102